MAVLPRKLCFLSGNGEYCTGDYVDCERDRPCECCVYQDDESVCADCTWNPVDTVDMFKAKGEADVQ